jgi:hypothetical protein
VFHLDLPGIAGLGLYDHQFYHVVDHEAGHKADPRTDYLVRAIEYFTNTLLLSNTRATADRHNVRIEVEPTYFNAYGAAQLDAIAPEKWPFADSYATAWKLFNGSFGPESMQSGWPAQRPLNTYADAVYAKVTLVGAKVDFFLANSTKAALFVAEMRELVTQAMLASDPGECGDGEELQPWCKLDGDLAPRLFQVGSPPHPPL